MNSLTLGQRVQTNENFAGPRFAGIRGTITKVVPGAYSAGYAVMELEESIYGAKSANILAEDVDRLVEPGMSIVLHNVYGSTRLDGVKATILQVRTDGFIAAGTEDPLLIPDDYILLFDHEFTVVVGK